MDKAQAIHNFWSSFGLPAYDEQTVPDEAVMPYITYMVETDSLEGMLTLPASIWYHSTSWAAVSRKAEEIAEYIVRQHPPAIKLDKGRLYLTKGTPFAQRMGDADDDMIRRIYLILNAEFLTAA